MCITVYFLQGMHNITCNAKMPIIHYTPITLKKAVTTLPLPQTCTRIPKQVQPLSNMNLPYIDMFDL